MATLSRSKAARSASPMRSNSPSRRSAEFSKGNLRKSIGTGRSLAASLDGTRSRKAGHTRSSTTDLANVENEYIRNLQQQIYYLDLEANYLLVQRREQAKKVSSIPPRVTEEADRMMRKLRDLQNEVEDRTSELARKEAQINMLDAEREAAIKKLRNAEETFTAEKRQLVNEIVSLKKLTDLRERDSTRRDLQAQQFRVEADKGLTALQDAEHRLQMYRSQLDQKTEECANARVELEEKRAECLKLRTQLQEMDERFFASQAKSKEELGRELREEIRQLRLQLREKEISSDQDRTLRTKIQDDCTSLIKENAALAAQVVELRKQIDMERSHADDKDMRRQVNIQELVTVRESEKQLKHELEKTKEVLRMEHKKHQDALEKLRQEGQQALEANLRRTQLRNELNELEGVNDSTNSENISLRRDKVLLTDEVATLNGKLDEKEEELERVRLRLEEAEGRVSQLETKVRMQRNLESIKWDEFEKLANTMREFSRAASPTKTAISDY